MHQSDVTEFLPQMQLVIKAKKLSYVSEETMPVQTVLLLSRISDIWLFKQWSSLLGMLEIYFTGLLRRVEKYFFF